MSMRRLPAQNRSRETVQRILTAAEELLVEIGYEAAVESPVPLIDRAGVSRGALYSFFSSPEHVMETVALRVLDDVRRITDDLVARSFETWEQACNAIIDTYLVVYANPANRQLWLKGHLSRPVTNADEAGNVYIAAQLGELFTRLTGGRADTELIRWQVAVELFDDLLRFAFRATPEGDARVIEETRIALRNYIRTLVVPEEYR
jgi:AcrR family transcriptional regulator